MRVTSLFLIVLLVAGAHADLLHIIKMPSYFKIGSLDHVTISNMEFRGLVKGMCGLPSSEIPQNFEITKDRGLKYPKLFVFLPFMSRILPSAAGFDFDSIQTTEPLDIKGLIEEVESFYPVGSAVSEEKHEDPVHVSDGLDTAITLVRKAKLSNPIRPLILVSPNMSMTVGAKKLITDFVKDVASSFGDDAVVFAITITAHSESRVKRQAQNGEILYESNIPDPSQLNVGKDYSEMYPVIFNIILWFMIAMGITIASVSYCIWFMDPGRDGIIYRMTASRVKKDL